MLHTMLLVMLMANNAASDSVDCTVVDFHFHLQFFLQMPQQIHYKPPKAFVGNFRLD